MKPTTPLDRQIWLGAGIITIDNGFAGKCFGLCLLDSRLIEAKLVRPDGKNEGNVTVQDAFHMAIYHKKFILSLIILSFYLSINQLVARFRRRLELEI